MGYRTQRNRHGKHVPAPVSLAIPDPMEYHPRNGIWTESTSMPPDANLTRIYVDADACPVKDEIYRVAIRHGLPVSVVAGNFIRVPQDPLIERIAAGSGMDAADDWIAERAHKGDIVITSDIPLASRCVKAGAEVIAPNGGTIDRHDPGGAQPDDRSALVRRSHRRPEILFAPRPFGLPVDARPDYPPHSAPARRTISAEPELK
jgi:hypothetical protein